MHHLTSRLVDSIGSIRVWVTNNRLKLNASKTDIHLVRFGSSSGQVFVWVDCGQRNFHSSIQDSPQPRSRPGSVFESGSSCHQANKYTVLPYTSAANDSSNAHQRCMPRSRQSPRSLEAGLLQRASCQCTGLSSDSTVRCDAAAARLILQLPRKSHVSDAIYCQLHWLDIWERVRFKLCVLARRCIQGSATSYLSRYCIPVSSIAGRSHFRSAASGDLFIPATNTVTIGPRAFGVACLAAWNSLPTELHDKNLSLRTFREKTETHLFKSIV